MDYVWLRYEGVTEHDLHNYLDRCNYWVVQGEVGELLIHKAGEKIDPEILKEGIHGLNAGLFCEVEVAEYDEIEHLL